MRYLFFAICLLIPLAAPAAMHRSTAAKHAFQRATPCPSTGDIRGRCPGYIIDHIMPLCAGGADSPSNMQWQTRADALRKDRDERRMCRR
jgi:hypothetical protein